MAHTSVAAAHFAEGDFRVGSVIRRSASMLSGHFLTFFIVTVIAHSPIILLARTLTPEPMDLDQVDLAIRPWDPSSAGSAPESGLLSPPSSAPSPITTYEWSRKASTSSRSRTCSIEHPPHSSNFGWVIRVVTTVSCACQLCPPKADIDLCRRRANKRLMHCNEDYPIRSPRRCGRKRTPGYQGQAPWRSSCSAPSRISSPAAPAGRSASRR